VQMMTYHTGERGINFGMPSAILECQPKLSSQSLNQRMCIMIVWQVLGLKADPFEDCMTMISQRSGFNAY
jgi:hypothetical protein